MTLAAVAYDYEGNPTKIYREVLRFTQDGASPVSEFIAQQSKSSSKAICAREDCSCLVIPVASKRQEGSRLNEIEMQQKQQAARAMVEELRKDRLQKEFFDAKMRRYKMIAKSYETNL